jgi:pyruvate dehydrogenase E1 component beta subunit
MAQLSYRDAVAAGIAQEMRRDERVVLFGEDTAAAGGVFKTTVGLLRNSGHDAEGHADLGARIPRGRWARR